MELNDKILEILQAERPGLEANLADLGLSAQQGRRIADAVTTYLDAVLCQVLEEHSKATQQDTISTLNEAGQAFVRGFKSGLR